MTIRPPWDFDARKIKVAFAGKNIRAKAEEGAVSFDVDVSLKDGYKDYLISFGP